AVVVLKGWRLGKSPQTPVDLTEGELPASRVSVVAPGPPDPERATGRNGSAGMGAAGRLGDLLVERRLVSPAQVDEALELQQQGSAQRLGEILVDIGALGERELVHPL